MKKFAVVTLSAMFALGAAQIASAGNNGLTGADKQNFSMGGGNAFGFGHDKNKVPGENNGFGNAFGQDKIKVEPGMGNNSIRNTYPMDPTAPNKGLGNAFGTAP